MPFWSKNKDFDQRLERLERAILSLAEKIEEIPQKKKSTKEEIFDKLNHLDRALIEKRLKSLEKKIKWTESLPYNQELESYDIETNPDTPVDINRLISNPMVRIALNSFLKNFNTSIDDLKNHPEKVIDILEAVTTKMKEKKKEAEEQKKPFNPYDPTLFMR